MEHTYFYESFLSKSPHDQNGIPGYSHRGRKNFRTDNVKNLPSLVQRHNIESHILQVNALIMTQKILTWFWFYFILQWSKSNCWNFNFWEKNQKENYFPPVWGTKTSYIITQICTKSYNQFGEVCRCYFKCHFKRNAVLVLQSMGQ